MKLGDEKINYLTHLIYQSLLDAGLIYGKDDVTIRGLIKKALRDQMAEEEILEEVVRKKIISQSRSIPEGGREWEILMEKYLEEEWEKKHDL